jgi:RNA polymerase sigma factor (sigma-70 family)
MMQSHTGSVLRHLRDLVAAEHTVQLPDRQLLERFRSQGEEAAFETLVRRHGPLVLGLCRRLLHNEHDAEDAFQATFTVLARKADLAGRRGSVGGWLYQVAYRAAVKARHRAASRQKHERQAGGRASPDPLAEVTGRELLAALDEELQRLPEHLRTPLVLCYLQGRTRDEAAGQLGWSLGTLKRRLEQGREVLRGRLARRGLTLPAALLATGLAEGSAAVPPLLAVATVKTASRAAVGGVPLGPLAEAVLKSVNPIKVKGAAACLAAAAALALAIGLLAAGQQSAQTKAVPPAASAPAKQPGNRAAPAPGAAQPKEGRQDNTITGRVSDAAGKALAGARVAVVAWPRNSDRGGDLTSKPPRELGQARTDAEGLFRLTVPPTPSTRFYKVVVLAGGQGYGLGWHPLRPDAGNQEAAIQLPAERVIRGRLVDLQGEPVGGVQVVATSAGRSVNGEFDGLHMAEPPDRLTLWPKPATTSADGRFVLRGLGRTCGVWMSVRSERFAPQRLSVEANSPPKELLASLSPAQLIEGVVTQADTGKPVPHARLTVYSSDQEYGGGGGLGGKADAQGRFRINPYPGKFFDVAAYAPDGQPYLTVQKKVRWPKGAVKQEVRIALPRGVLVRGKITESASGKPVAGASVQYLPLQANNPNYRGDVITGWQGIVVSAADGVFQIPVLPGPGHLLVTGPTLDYVHQEVGNQLLSNGKPGGIRYYPDALVKLDLPAAARTKEVTVTLRRGVTVTGKLVGPDGKPVARALMLTRLNISALSLFWRFPVEVNGGRFELRGCDPKESYPVAFLDPKNRLGASVTLSGKQAGKSVTVKLAPCGRATARFVDAKGKALANIRPLLEIVITPGAHRFDFEAYRKGLLIADGDLLANVDRANYWTGPTTDARGRVTFPALVPGVTYRLRNGDLGKKVTTRDFTVESGKTLDLGDVTYGRME